MNIVHFQSRIGGRSENQDFFGEIQTQLGHLIVVCDGMGGHKGGRLAAEMAVNTILKEVQKSVEQDPSKAIMRAVEKSNTLIYNYGNSNLNVNGLGTTVVALLLTADKAVCCYVGDSRLYQLRKGEIIYRTFDHSHVFDLVRAGVITEEEARVSNKSNIITRALGTNKQVKIEINNNLSFKIGDRFLLCTDGIWAPIPEDKLVKIASYNGEVKSIVLDLVNEIDELGKALGGVYDNLTVGIVEITESIKNYSNRSSSKKYRPKFGIIFLVIISLISLIMFLFKQFKLL